MKAGLAPKQDMNSAKPHCPVRISAIWGEVISQKSGQAKIAMPAVPNIRTGFRPIRSESAPEGRCEIMAKSAMLLSIRAVEEETWPFCFSQVDR